MVDSCSWCGKDNTLLERTENKRGSKIFLCPSCMRALKNGECRKCGKKSDYFVDGLCEDCQQLEQYLENNEETGITQAVLNMFRGDDLEIDEVKFNKCIEMLSKEQKSIGPELLKTNEQAKKFWLTFKLMQVGIKDQKVINENYEDMMYIMNNDVDKLLYRMSLLKICDTEEKLDEIKGIEVLASKGNVYFIFDDRLER